MVDEKKGIPGRGNYKEIQTFKILKEKIKIRKEGGLGKIKLFFFVEKTNLG